MSVWLVLINDCGAHSFFFVLQGVPSLLGLDYDCDGMTGLGTGATEVQ